MRFDLFMVVTLYGVAASAETVMSREDWMKKVHEQQIMENTLCHKDSLLVTCFSPVTKAKDPKENGKTLSEAECKKGVKDVTVLSLHSTSYPKKSDSDGMFYHKLQQNLGEYHMKDAGERLAKLVYETVKQALAEQGASETTSFGCTMKKAKAFKVDVPK